MFMSDVNKKDEIRNIVVQDLKQFGVKHRPKKQKQYVQEIKPNRKVFKKPLQYLPMQTVTMPNGQQLVVPKVVNELCAFIFSKVDTEGLFRKGGAKSRQNEIKLYLDAGCHLNDEHHEIDVASVLKTFFRELPEPLLPYAYHEIFLRCMLLAQNQLEAIMLCCLLLPSEHLNTLTYFMQFLNQVTEFSNYNKMDAYNLSVVIGPTLLPVDEKTALTTPGRLAKICELFKILIENAYEIGVLPKTIIDRIEIKTNNKQLDDDATSNVKKKKKRRSGSLTRMLNGLKKMVSTKTSEEEPNLPLPTPDLLITPNLSQSSKKRKMENGFSNKVRKDLMQKLPQNSALSTPFAPSRTPISVDPNPDMIKSSIATKKSLMKASEATSASTVTLALNKPKENKHNVNIKKRWSAVSQATFKRTKKRSSCGPALESTSKSSSSTASNDNIQSSDHEDKNARTSSTVTSDVGNLKSEYEEIKNRVLAIERRLSLELVAIPPNDDDGNASIAENPIEKVQDKYEQTLHQMGQLSPTTDHLARRLSRELKIRSRSEHRVIRSPSARKIGSLRRKSRELERRQSWHVAKLEEPLQQHQRQHVIETLRYQTNPRQRSVKNGNSDAVVEVPSASGSACTTNPKSPSMSGSTITTTTATTSSSSCGRWSNNISPMQTPTRGDNCRPSILRLRNQHAGMVLAKAKLFDNLLDTDPSTFSSLEDTHNLPRAKPGHKIGNIRRADRQMARVRTLKADERKLSRKSLSPRKRSIQRHNKYQLLAKASSCDTSNASSACAKDNNKENCSARRVAVNSPQNVPYIKKTLNNKSPKRLHRTPNKIDNNKTPIRVTVRDINTDF